MTRARLLPVLALAACARAPLEDNAIALTAPAPPAPEAPAVVTASPPIAPEAPRTASRPAVPAPSPAAYPWLAAQASFPPPVESLEARFDPPAGFTRDVLAEGSFGAFLRRLPLAARGTPVRSHRGAVILPADHPSLAAVVAIDVGAGDLQQCADSIIRLHAEWLWAKGKRDLGYRAASGAAMPFARWAQGERMQPEGTGFRWTASARPDGGYPSFRRWLDGVFAWANTGSLARDTEHVAEADLRAGDFVVQPGGPGHAVLVLDVARATDGRRALLLGQGFMPAQSFQVLHAPPRSRPKQTTLGAAWFIVEPGALALDTPFWAPFPWKTLHRFPGT